MEYRNFDDFFAAFRTGKIVVQNKYGRIGLFKNYPDWLYWENILRNVWNERMKKNDIYNRNTVNICDIDWDIPEKLEKKEIKMLPNISSYGSYDTKGYGLHTLKVDLGAITLFYSYKTIVAYTDYNDGLVVCKNAWGTTTGKHLNWIDGGNKKYRLDYEDFQKKLTAALDRHMPERNKRDEY